MNDLTREEFEAKLETAAARTEGRFVQLDGKVDRLAEAFASFATNITAKLDEVKADNRNTRWTISVTVVVSMLAFLAALWTTQSNLLAAFQAGIAVSERPAATVPPGATGTR